VESAGSRRGAQMGVLRCDPSRRRGFIPPKRPGRPRHFNISVGVTDAFMQAVENDAEIEAGAQGAAGSDAIASGAYQRGGRFLWVYAKPRARELWDRS